MSAELLGLGSTAVGTVAQGVATGAAHLPGIVGFVAGIVGTAGGAIGIWGAAKSYRAFLPTADGRGEVGR